MLWQGFTNKLPQQKKDKKITGKVFNCLGTSLGLTLMVLNLYLG